MEPDEAGKQSWAAFLETRPPKIQRVAELLPPWELYRINSGHRVTIYSFDEDENDPGGRVELTVNVLGVFNPEGLVFDRRVYGIKPDEMVPCDLPVSSEDQSAGS